MGLDVTAFRQLKIIPGAAPDQYDEAPDGLWCPGTSMEWSEGEWPGRAEGIPDARACYSYTERDDSIGYSYGSHRIFRDMLAELVGRGEAKKIWDDPQPGPFVELINFADNDGVIGPAVAKKLSDDFAAHRDEAQRRFSQHPWAWNVYQKWQAACEMAADGGALDFH